VNNSIETISPECLVEGSESLTTPGPTPEGRLEAMDAMDACVAEHIKVEAEYLAIYERDAMADIDMLSKKLDEDPTIMSLLKTHTEAAPPAPAAANALNLVKSNPATGEVDAAQPRKHLKPINFHQSRQFLSQLGFLHYDSFMVKEKAERDPGMQVPALYSNFQLLNYKTSPLWRDIKGLDKKPG
jgi:hypothetical protein